MKNKEFIVDCVGSFVLIVLAFFVLVFNAVQDVQLNFFLPLFLMIYAVLHLATFMVHVKNKEFSNLFLGIIGLVFGLGACFIDVFQNPKYLAFFILMWAFFWGLIKLKKADYFHDRKTKHWLVAVIGLILFLFISIVVSINLAYEANVQILVLGFYLLFLGVFELYEALFLSLTKGKLK